MVATENPLLDLGIKFLYYIAPVENLKSILKRGIMNKKKVESLNLTYADYSDRDVQSIREERSLHSFVPLFPNTRNAMTFRYQKSGVDFVILRLMSDLVTQYDCNVSDRIAACRFARIMDLTPQSLKLIGIEDIVRTKNFYGDQELRQRVGAEILVNTDIIDPKWIEGVYLKQGKPVIRDLDVKQYRDKNWRLYFHIW